MGHIKKRTITALITGLGSLGLIWYLYGWQLALLLFILQFSHNLEKH